MPAAIPVDDILLCWFGEAARAPEQIPSVSGRWYNGGPDFDRELVSRFGPALDTAAQTPDWDGADIRERLARVLLLDQFSRNLYRGTPRAFATDAHALKLSQAAIDRGADTTLSPIECSFFGMPLQHAEDLRIQERSVAYFQSLLARARSPEEHRNLAGNLDFAEQHAAIIRRFGRFPHRNAVLGRDSTPEEAAYLQAGAPHFGQ